MTDECDHIAIPSKIVNHGLETYGVSFLDVHREEFLKKVDQKKASNDIDQRFIGSSHGLPLISLRGVWVAFSDFAEMEWTWLGDSEKYFAEFLQHTHPDFTGVGYYTDEKIDSFYWPVSVKKERELLSKVKIDSLVASFGRDKFPTSRLILPEDFESLLWLWSGAADRDECVLISWYC